MPSYNKTLSPPKGEPFLETEDGLKYWLVDADREISLVRTVQTEDASISMHYYFGHGRDEHGYYLFRYQGFQIGFVDHEIDGFHDFEHKTEIDRSNNTSTLVIQYVGTDVRDAFANKLRDANGRVIRKEDSGAPISDPNISISDTYIIKTGWRSRNFGKFDSQEQQEAMRLIWADLFTGIWGNLRRLRPGARQGLIKKMRFSERVLNQFKDGDLIDD